MELKKALMNSLNGYNYSMNESKKETLNYGLANDTSHDLDACAHSIEVFVNYGFELTESMMWPIGTKRIQAETLKEYISNKQMMIATSKEDIVGCLRIITKTDSQKQALNVSMLAVDSKWHGHGIGLQLMKEAEKLAIKSGCVKLIGEVLFPEDKTIQKSRIRLLNWYLGMGFKTTRIIPFEDLYPEKSKGLLTPCYLQGIEKHLV